MAQTEMEAALSEDALDLGVTFSDVQSTDVIAEPLYDEQLCLVVDAGHPAFIHDEIAVAELENIDLALLDSSFDARESIDRYLRANNSTETGRRRYIRFTCDSDRTADVLDWRH